MKLYTADICDKYNQKVQILEPIFKSYGKISNCNGEIFTIELFEDNSALVELLKNTNGKNKICVVDVKGDKCAVVGENLMKFAFKNDWAGIVINGYVRDIHETKEIAVGLFALGTYPLKSTKKAKANQNINLEFANVVLKNGAFLYADDDGIVVLDKKI
jgi:regulator of ribonuclease activity A